MITLRATTAVVVRELRHRLLRPHQQPHELVYVGDNFTDTLHAGAFDGETLVGIATISHQPPRDSDDPHAWRLRGMAVVPELRGQGIGAKLFEMCAEHVLKRGGKVIWATARVPAIAFYARFGFEPRGEQFEFPQTGPHYYIYWHADDQ